MNILPNAQRLVSLQIRRHRTTTEGSALVGAFASGGTAAVYQSGGALQYVASHELNEPASSAIAAGLPYGYYNLVRRTGVISMNRIGHWQY